MRYHNNIATNSRNFRFHNALDRQKLDFRENEIYLNTCDFKRNIKMNINIILYYNPL